MSSIQNHIKNLETKHDELERLVREEESRPSPDEFRIQDLKKEKLLLKEKIEEFRKEELEDA